MAAVDIKFNVCFPQAVLVLINGLLYFTFLMVSSVILDWNMAMGFKNKFKVFFQPILRFICVYFR